ncbi:MAG: N-acetylmuramoyl-L-alanine amidase [Pseudomonadota bacterium]
MALLTHPSPNFNDRPDGTSIDMVILHYTGMRSGGAALERLCDRAAQVSAHYLVEEDGTCHSLVAEEKRAWHAGLSSWQGISNLNDQSIGIEIVNPGHEWGYTAFPAAQIEAVFTLLREIKDRHQIKPTRILGHSDVAPGRKEDPGEKFPWDRLSAEGLAIGTFQGGFDASGEDALSYSEAILSLRDIGYDVPDNHHAAAVLAFQRRFCPAALGQGINPLTKAAIEWAKRKFAP